MDCLSPRSSLTASPPPLPPAPGYDKLLQTMSQLQGMMSQAINNQTVTYCIVLGDLGQQWGFHGTRALIWGSYAEGRQREFTFWKSLSGEPSDQCYCKARRNNRKPDTGRFGSQDGG